MSIDYPGTPASPETLMRQAVMTSAEYMSGAIREIDAKFGEGYAKKHPELVAAFINSCAMDYATNHLTVFGDRAIEHAHSLVDKARRK